MAHLEAEAEVQDQETSEFEEGSIEWGAEQLANKEIAQSEAPEQETEITPEIEVSDEEDIPDDIEQSDDDVEELKQEQEEPEIEAIPAPVSWSNEDKSVFSNLPPDAQNIILKRESEREKGYQFKTTELAEKSKLADELQWQINNDRQQSTEFMAKLMKSNLQEPTMELLHSDPYEYAKQKQTYDQSVAQQNQMQREAENYQRMAEERQHVEHQRFVMNRDAALNEMLPQLQDHQYQTEMVDYGRSKGLTEQAFQNASAEELVILDKAMKFDAMQAGKPKLKDQLKNVPKVLKAGVKPQGNKKSRDYKAALTNLKKSGSLRDAEAAFASR